MSDVVVRSVDFARAQDAQALLSLLDHYAASPMGGGANLSAYAREHLIGRLSAWPGYVGFVAWRGDEPVGLINCFLGFSTFAARPLLNIHDVVVKESARGAGIGRALMAAAENAARERGCCKLTLEVLTGNPVAMSLYEKVGYHPYQLDPRTGQAVFMEKKL